MNRIKMISGTGIGICLCLWFTAIPGEPGNNDNNAENHDKKMSTEKFYPPEWVHQTNIYEVNLRQYTPEGTINAFLPHMARLKEMGVETLWFMPITPIAQKKKKGTLGSYYACSDYEAVSSEFGTMADFKNLVKQAHAMNMKVIIDWVANHTGWDHVWTKSHPDWYLKDAATGDFQIASGMDDIIELDFKNREMREAMIAAMRLWVKECDIDGFRSDLAFWVEFDFWQEARSALEKEKKLFWLGELDPLENPEYMGVYDAAYTWTWMHKAKDFYQQGLRITELDSVLNRYEALGNESMRAWFTTNHDENSWNGTEYEKYGDMAKALAVFSCTWNGIPLLYSGQELPNRKRLEFFEKDPIGWTGYNELKEFYKTLLTLHHTHPALRAGDNRVKTYRISTTADDKIFAFLREYGDKKVFVVLNLSKTNTLNFQVKDEKLRGKLRNVFSGIEEFFNSERQFEMQAWEYQVYAN
jgi:alpha-amylase